VVAFLLLLYLTRAQWFFDDEWEVIANRGFAGHPLNLFFPHNEHWSTIPILIYRGLFALFGLHSYLPYMFVLLVLHVAVAHTLWRLMIRAGADQWVATVLVAVFLVLGAGYEDLTWAFQLAWLASILCGLVGLYLVDHDAPFGWKDVAGWGVLIAGLMSSGIGVTMVAMVGAAALLRRGPRAGLAIISVPAVVYAVWLLAVGRNGIGGVPISRTGFLLWGDFIWRGLTVTVEGISGLAGFGAVAIVGIFVWLAVHWRDARTAGPVFAGAAGAAVFFLIVGVGRVSLGVDQATAPRYIYIGAALLLPSVGFVTSSLARRDRVAQLAAVALLAFGALHGLAVLVNQELAFAVVKQQSKRDILASAGLVSAGTALIGDHPDPRWAPDLTVQELAEMQAEGKLPAADDVNDTDRLDALLALEVAVGDTPALAQAASVTVVAGTGGFLGAGPGGCIRAITFGGKHYVTLRFSTPGYVEIHAPAGEVEEATLTSASRAGTSNPRRLTFPSGAAAFLSSQVSPSRLTLNVSATSIDICGVVAQQP